MEYKLLNQNLPYQRTKSLRNLIKARILFRETDHLKTFPRVNCKITRRTQLDKIEMIQPPVLIEICIRLGN